MRGLRGGRRVCALAATVGIGLIGAAIAHAAPPRAASDDGEWLFVLSANDAKLRALPASRSFKLTLRSPSPTVEAFTDRPARRLDFEPLSRFVDAWSTYGFKRVPPNAAIEVENGLKPEDVLIVSLSRPRLNKKGSLSYRAKPLRGERRLSDLRYFQRRADGRLPARLGPTTLFIDDAGDSSAQLELNFQASAAHWHAVFLLSSFKLEAFTVGSPGLISYQDETGGPTSGFALETSLTGAGVAFGRVNPIGDCLPIVIEQIVGAPNSLTGEIGEGPTVALAYGQNKVPVDAQANCK